MTLESVFDDSFWPLLPLLIAGEVIFQSKRISMIEFLYKLEIEDNRLKLKAPLRIGNNCEKAEHHFNSFKKTQIHLSLHPIW